MRSGTPFPALAFLLILALVSWQLGLTLAALGSVWWGTRRWRA